MNSSMEDCKDAAQKKSVKIPTIVTFVVFVGVFLLLGMGMVVGCLILLIEHLFYRYTLPILRHKPKGTIWRSRNIMFFSQVIRTCVQNKNVIFSIYHLILPFVGQLRYSTRKNLTKKQTF